MDSIIGFILVITPLVFIHELGHYFMARHAGVAVQVFSVGFGPEIFGFYDRNNTRWRLSLIPLGGYVKMLGEGADTDEKITSHYNGGSLEAAPLLSRMAIVSFGPLANILLAFAVLVGVNWHYGVYKSADYLSSGIGSVAENSAASEAGLQAGDVIVSLNERSVSSFEDIITAISRSEGQPMLLRYQRGDTTYQDIITPQLMTDTAGNQRLMLGIGAPLPEKQPVDLWEASATALSQTYFLGKQILYGIGGLLSGSVDYNQLGGPIKIAEYSGESLRQGIESFLFFTAMLSVNLAVINLFPIPGLDGGHFMLMVIEGIMRRKPSETVVRVANNGGIFLVLMLIIVITVKDIWDLI